MKDVLTLKHGDASMSYYDYEIMGDGKRCWKTWRGTDCSGVMLENVAGN